jgi:hypothetical protein
MKLIALIDSGSSATFIDPSVTVKGNLPVQNLELVEVTQAVTSGCQYSNQGHKCTTDFTVLDLEGYDLILGCDRIFEFNPVGINLKTREFTIEKDG